MLVNTGSTRSSDNLAVTAAGVVSDYFECSVSATRRFFAKNAPLIAKTCAEFAARFERGGSILAFGEGPQASDAHHLAVEFVHPVVVGKRALPATAFTSSGANAAMEFASANDIAIGFVAGENTSAVEKQLGVAQRRGLYTTLLHDGRTPPSEVDAEFAVVERDPLIVQELHETVYHVLWELVHVFLEHQPAAAIDADHGSGFERELYPYLFATDLPARESRDLLRDVEYSTRQKAEDIAVLRSRIAAADALRIGGVAQAVADRVRRGGRVIAFGNGGSATDADDVAADCLRPAHDSWRVITGMSLTAETAILTAIANDVGFDHVFARQISAFVRADDVVIGFSTSGSSRNVIAAMSAAKARGALTVGFSGADGGPLAKTPDVDCCFVVPAEYTPRIQEAHATMWHALLTGVQHVLARDGERR